MNRAADNDGNGKGITIPPGSPGRMRWDNSSRFTRWMIDHPTVLLTISALVVGGLSYAGAKIVGWKAASDQVTVDTQINTALVPVNKKIDAVMGHQATADKQRVESCVNQRWMSRMVQGLAKQHNTPGVGEAFPDPCPSLNMQSSIGNIDH